MAMNYTIPAGSMIRTESVTIPSIFNIDTGLYEFSSKIDLMQIDKKGLYLLDSLIIGANVSDAVYYESLEITPKIEMWSKVEDYKFQHFPNALLLNAIGRQSMLSGFFYQSTDDTLQIKCNGSLKQVVDTIGLDAIDIIITASIYRISNQEYIDKIKSQRW